MTGSIAPNRPGHHGTVVARTVGTVAISCNVIYSSQKRQPMQHIGPNVSCTQRYRESCCSF